MSQPNSSIFSFKYFVLRYLIPFLVVISGCVYIFGYIFEKKVILSSEISGAYKINRMLNTNDVNEIPIIGSSRAQGGYIPDSIVSPAFNYGIDGVGMDVTLFLIEKELRKEKTTPLIINVDMEGFVASRGDLMNYLLNSSDPNVRSLVGDKFSFINYLPGIKYYGYFEWYLKYYLNERLEVTKAINRGGSFELNVFNPVLFKQNIDDRLKEPSSFTGNKQMTDKLERLVSGYSGRTFYFVVAPYHSAYLSSFKNREDFFGYFGKLNKYSNVNFLDFSSLNLPDSCFYNTTHINYRGAIVFSDSLKRRMAASFR